MNLSTDLYNLRTAYQSRDPETLAYEIEGVLLKHGDFTYRACVAILSAYDPEYHEECRQVLDRPEFKAFPNNLAMLRHLLNLIHPAHLAPKEEVRKDIPQVWVKNDARQVIAANKNHPESLEIAMLYHLVVLSLNKPEEHAA